jgi:hypothetical protein
MGDAARQEIVASIGFVGKAGIDGAHDFGPAKANAWRARLRARHAQIQSDLTAFHRTIFSGTSGRPVNEVERAVYWNI